MRLPMPPTFCGAVPFPRNLGRAQGLRCNKNKGDGGYARCTLHSARTREAAGAGDGGDYNGDDEQHDMRCA